MYVSSLTLVTNKKNTVTETEKTQTTVQLYIKWYVYLEFYAISFHFIWNVSMITSSPFFPLFVLCINSIDKNEISKTLLNGKERNKKSNGIELHLIKKCARKESKNMLGPISNLHGTGRIRKLYRRAIYQYYIIAIISDKKINIEKHLQLAVSFFYSYSRDYILE